MKKLISIILILLTLLSCSSCGKSIEYDKIHFDSVNYNNLYDTFETFWSNGDTTFYNSDGFYNQRLFLHCNGIKQKLFENSDFSTEQYNGSFLPINDFAYFNASSYTDDTEYIYKYSFKDQNYTKIFQKRNIGFWIGTPDFIAYTTWKEDYLYSDLFVYDIKAKKETLVCDEILEFGVVENKIRYILPEKAKSYSVYEYNPNNHTTKKLGIFNASIPDEEYSTFNFTKNFVTITQLNNKLIVYSIGGKTETYTLPKTINQFIAADKFAYALCYNEDEYGGAEGENEEGIYRINLSDGKFQRIPYSVESNSKSSIVDFSDLDFRVTSDDEIYILQGNLALGTLYKKHVFKMNVPKNTIEKLFVY